MKQPRTFLLLGVVVAILLLSVAYAAINNINFNISGTVTATPDQASFKVAFTRTQNFWDTYTVEYIDDTTANIIYNNVKVGEPESESLYIENTMHLKIRNNSDYPVYVRPVNAKQTIKNGNYEMDLNMWLEEYVGDDGFTSQSPEETACLQPDAEYALVIQPIIHNGSKDPVEFKFTVGFEASPYSDFTSPPTYY